jgi:hypothetical protein
VIILTVFNHYPLDFVQRSTRIGSIVLVLSCLVGLSGAYGNEFPLRRVLKALDLASRPKRTESFKGPVVEEGEPRLSSRSRSRKSPESSARRAVHVALSAWRQPKFCPASCPCVVEIHTWPQFGLESLQIEWRFDRALQVAMLAIRLLREKALRGRIPRSSQRTVTGIDHQALE